MADYYFKDGQFIIENYNQKNPFANFLPGVAGKMGIPLWTFYVNRGQAISGYGLQDKNHPIMTFTPANKAYETVAFDGFRTFIKTSNALYEPFQVDSKHTHKMMIDQSSFSIEEHNKSLGIKTKVTYFGLANEPMASLVRKVQITNTSSYCSSFEILDGIAEILPSGIQNEAFKSVSNVLASWMDVKHLDDNIAFYCLRGSTGDSSEVNMINDGNFYLAFTKKGLIKPIVDKHLVFGQNTAKTTPQYFMSHSIEHIVSSPQVFANKLPCAFMPLKTSLEAGESIELYALSGHSQNIELLRKMIPRVTCSEYIKTKQIEASTVIEIMLNDVNTDSAYPIFDKYVKQNYLDNILRGGYPEKIGNTIYHLFSRRHGDLERDYNFFSLAPEYYSQGNGNFRDVCQNRRMDSFINKDVDRFNIYQFANLIQLDGYNPLSINGTLFTLNPAIDQEALVKRHFDCEPSKGLECLKRPFTPGKIVNCVERNQLSVKTDTETYLNDIINHSDAHIEASFGEGFWIDHFTYIIDLIETYQNIFPDRMSQLLFDSHDYAYYDSPVSVKSVLEKRMLNDDQQVRQYDSLRHYDKEKIAQLKMHPNNSNWAKIRGKVYQSNLYIKLLVLVLTKHSNLDPHGLGIEMEANKPGWNDAMNGLPGLIGSGFSETIELLRIIEFMLKQSTSDLLTLPIELYDLLIALKQSTSYLSQIKSKETYRDAIRFGLSGKLKSIAIEHVTQYLESLRNHIHKSINTLYEEHQGIIPTFLFYNVTQYELQYDNDTAMLSPKGKQLVKPLQYQRASLPAFLEAPARLFKTDFDKHKLHDMHQAILKSELYDHTLKVYKTSVSLDQESHEIGRIHAFTKGWLERESNFLHMTYKYLLGLLKAGFYKAFYDALNTNLVCFMDPSIYGRSTLENSSFIVPTNNPNPQIHGQGFFARLSGSTVETINMWAIMMTGGQPFKYVEGKLILKLEPKLDKSFFKTDKTLTFNFLKDIEVTYVNDNLSHTYEQCDITKIELTKDGVTTAYHSDSLTGEIAYDVRNGLYKKIKIYMNKKEEKKQ